MLEKKIIRLGCFNIFLSLSLSDIMHPLTAAVHCFTIYTAFNSSFFPPKNYGNRIIDIFVTQTKILRRDSVHHQGVSDLGEIFWISPIIKSRAGPILQIDGNRNAGHYQPQLLLLFFVYAQWSKCITNSFLPNIVLYDIVHSLYRASCHQCTLQESCLIAPTGWAPLQSKQSVLSLIV